MYKTFGDLLKHLRNKHKITQSYIAKLTGYSADTIRGIENNRSTPSVSLVNNLSHIFNMDLNKYFYIYEHNIPTGEQNAFIEFRSAIEELDKKKLIELIKRHENNLYFQSNDGLQLIYYAKAVCEYPTNKEASIRYTNLALSVSDISMENLDLENQIYTITVYSILNFIIILHLDETKLSFAENLALTLYENLNNNFFSDLTTTYLNFSETTRLYIVLLNNLSDIELRKNNVDAALNYINKSINICIYNYKPYLLHKLYFTKFECLYQGEYFKDAIFVFEQILMFSSVVNPKVTSKYFNELYDQFPEMLKIMDISFLRAKYLP
ncbi:MAG: helix-turn-helix transcriptional regulator [Lachnospirales bacterium]